MPIWHEAIATHFRSQPMTQSRSQQLQEDTKATLEIASQMVDALYAGLVTRIEVQEQEIDRLRDYIRELEDTIDASSTDILALEELGEKASAADTSKNLSGYTRLVP